MNQNFYFHCNVIATILVIHCCIWFEQKVSCAGLLRDEILKHLNDYAEFNSQTSYIMFSHDYLCLYSLQFKCVCQLACYIYHEQKVGSCFKI